MAEVCGIITALIKMMFFDYFAGQWINWIHYLYIECSFATNAPCKAFLGEQDATSGGNDWLFHYLGLSCLLCQAGAGVTGFPNVGPGCVMTCALDAEFIFDQELV